MASAEPSDPSVAKAPSIGEVLEERYRLDDHLGEGGVGWVFRATHLKLGSEVAIKMLQERFSEHSMMRPRFVREAKALAALKHPHIVTITDFSFSRDRPYIVMELLDGRSLREVITEDGPLAPERARRIVMRILDALAFAHDLGFVHRDLKPDNIFLLDLPNDDSFPKLLDFGFVKLTSTDSAETTVDVLTRSGIAFGTPAYMSPEQATGGSADARSDLYSLGIVLYEMLVGRRPFEGTLPEIVRQHLTAPIPYFEDRDAAARETPELRELFERALAKEPDGRFADAKAMRNAAKALPSPFLRSGELRDATVSGEAPTVAAVPHSKRTQRGSIWGTLGALLLFVGVVGGVAGLVAVAATMGAEENAPADVDETPVTTAQPAPAEPEPTPSPGQVVPAEQAVGTPAFDTAALEAAVYGEEDPAEQEEEPNEELGTEAEGETEAVAPEETGPEEAEPVEAEPEDTRSPWEMRRRVNLLTQARRRVLRDRPLTSGSERAVKRYVRGHRDDPRPHLVLAQSFVARRWHSAALERYQLALRIDPRSTNDPRMKRDLVRLAAGDSVADEAADEVVRLYGADAVETIDRELARSTDDATRTRLQRLRARVAD
ncbi:MAG: protein kinase [Myxococcota bacterium]